MGVVQFDKGPDGAPLRFETPERLITAWHADEVAPAFAEMEAARAAGRWLAGFASYELGYALIAKLVARMPEGREVPLLQFGVFDAPRAVAGPVSGGAVSGPAAEDAGRFEALAPLWSPEDYARAFAVVHDAIGAGDIYQANLTFPVTGRWAGDLDALYRRMQAHQPVPHGACLDFGGPVLLSRSPELFFAVDAQGVLTTRPMKGTAPRGAGGADDRVLRAALAASAKDQAENLMIVDLLRNDMSRVSQVGSVRVPELFTVEDYATVFQMTSRITSRLIPGTTLARIFEALFPCGSITGAPKIRAMEILSELEPEPRGAYCGALGWAGPDGAMSFNVAIRTVTCFRDGRARFGVGGGVVHDSTAAGEYDEALLKGRFATAL